MIQEYLFTSDKYKSELETFSISDEIDKKINSIENSTCWILRLLIDGENENAAKSLDSVNKEICEKYKPTILSNGCSAYFNKSLFPIVNEFERKLRKLLYLGSALQKGSEDYDVINDLEVKDLGKIFEALFCDAEFVKSIKSKINNKSSQFTRNELILMAESMVENTLWNELFGMEYVKTLHENFEKVRQYRNDVMHAHNINFEQFKSAKQLFKNVNKELDIAIGKLVGAVEENRLTTYENYNKTLETALLSVQNQIDVNVELNSSILKYYELLNDLSKIDKVKNEIAPALSELDNILKKIELHDLKIPYALTRLKQGLSEIEIKYNYLSGK